MKNIWFGLSAGISFLISIVFIGLGFHKMFVYERWDSPLLEDVNAYVGGDAYNYIINANYATAYFVLATMLLILGCFLISFRYMNANKK